MSRVIISPGTKTDNRKIAAGQHTTVTADDTVVTGLDHIDSVVVGLDGGPDSAVGSCSAAVPASGGSIHIKTYDTAGSSPFAPAATTFSKKVNWIAIGR